MRRSILMLFCGVAAALCLAVAARANSLGRVPGASRYTLVVAAPPGQRSPTYLFRKLISIHAATKGSANRRAKQATVKLLMHLNSDKSLYAWHLVVIAHGSSARVPATLQAISKSGTVVAAYHLTSAWPSKLQIEGFKQRGTEAMYLAVTFAAASISRVK